MREASRDYYPGWNIVAVAMLFQAFLFGLSIYAFTMWVPGWAAEFEVPRTTIMLAMTALIIVGGFLAPFAGHALDRVSIRMLVAGGAAALSLGFALISLATSVWQIIAIYGSLVALAMTFAGPLAAQTLTARWFSARRGMALGIVATGTSLGGAVLPPAVTYLFLEYGWRTTHLVMATTVAVLVIPIVLLVIRNSPEDAGVAPEEPSPHPISRPRPSPARTWTMREVLSHRDFWVIAISFLPLAMASIAVQHNLSPFASDAGIGAQQISFLVSITAVTMVLAKLGFGGLADRVDHRLLFLSGAAAVVVMLLTMLGPRSYPLLIVVSMLLGVSLGAFLPLMAAMISARFGTASFGKVSGLAHSVGMLNAIGPILAARSSDTTGSYDGAIYIFLGLIVPACLLIGLLKSPADRGRASLAGD